MTNEEARKTLKEIKPIPIDGFKIIADAYDMAIEALEKQTPKKPIEKFAFSDDIEAGLCPLCNEGVNEEMDFCSYCGQAIYWEVSE